MGDGPAIGWRAGAGPTVASHGQVGPGQGLSGGWSWLPRQPLFWVFWTVRGPGDPVYSGFELGMLVVLPCEPVTARIMPK